MYKLIPWCLLAISLPSPAAQEQPPTHIHHDEALHFDYTYPAEFEVAPQVATAFPDAPNSSTPAAQNEPTGCVTTTFSAAHTITFGAIEAILITQLDLDCLKLPADTPIDGAYLGTLALGSLREGLSKFPNTNLADPVPYTLGLRPAAIAQGSGSNGPARSGYSSVVCTAVQRNAVCFAAFTSRASRLPTLLASTISFGSEPPIPLVPPSLLTS